MRAAARVPRPALALAVALALLLAGQARAGAEVSDPSCGTMAVVMRSGTVIYRLPHRFLRAGSDSVRVGARALVRGHDYLIDLLRGELRLLQEPAPGETLQVSACWLLAPPPLEVQLVRYRPPAPAPESAGAPVPAPAVPPRPGAPRAGFAAPAGASLQLTGNKTLAVDFGSSQDATLRQSLDLAVSGSLAPGVTLTGVLSDRNTPLTATGSTQDLQALDRVLIQLKAPHSTATLGDLTLSLTDGEFGRVERRLQGASATWNVGGVDLVGAAASAQGEFRRMEFIGVEGLQGPYQLTDAGGSPGVAVVPGSEVVTVDGQRMTRGESADYFMDYEAGQITFTNRRLLTGQSRITVEYQFSVTAYRRNLSAAGARWQGRAGWLFTRALVEDDDKGRPIGLTLDASDQQVLQAAGDSASRALGNGVSPGVGDYDSVRVAPATLIYAYAGPDSGHFAVSFARVGSGLGDYVDSTSVGGKAVYRWVGRGNGDFTVGRALPLPESHHLVTAGGGLRLGIATLEAEGAYSRLDRNTFSTLDDGDDGGRAGRLALTLAGRAAGPLPGDASLSVQARTVGRTFTPFVNLERPFAQEDWGVPIGADLDHQDRIEALGRYALAGGTQLTARLGRIRTADGFAAVRSGAEWTRAGRLGLHLLWERADARRDGWEAPDGARRHLRGDLRLGGGWIEPSVRVESDERTAPSDSVRTGSRFREGAFLLQSAARFSWHSSFGFANRTDASPLPAGFLDQSRSHTWSAGLESPVTGAFGVALHLQRRDVLPLADPQRSRSDLGSLRLRGEDKKRGLHGTLSIETTSEGVNERTRTVVFVGNGAGAYDQFGNFVGHGDYDVIVSVSSTLDQVARAATSAALGMDFGHSEVWHGSRVEFAFEGEARRRGELRGSDLFVSPGAAAGDPTFVHASVTQRLESDLAPGSRSAALHARLERQVVTDRLYAGFGQTTEDRQGTLRWRARPGPLVTVEVEGHARRQVASQELSGGLAFHRSLDDDGATGQLVYTPTPVWRLTAFGETSWARPEGQDLATRTLRLGPDVGVALGARGRAEVSVRRAFVSGPPAVGLLPSADPAGAPQWENSARVDYRVRQSTTLGLSFLARAFPGLPTHVEGRAELRAFF